MRCRFNSCERCDDDVVFVENEWITRILLKIDEEDEGGAGGDKNVVKIVKTTTIDGIFIFVIILTVDLEFNFFISIVRDDAGHVEFDVILVFERNI